MESPKWSTPPLLKPKGGVSLKLINIGGAKSLISKPKKRLRSARYSRSIYKFRCLRLRGNRSVHLADKLLYVSLTAENKVSYSLKG